MSILNYFSSIDESSHQKQIQKLKEERMEVEKKPLKRPVGRPKRTIPLSLKAADDTTASSAASAASSAASAASSASAAAAAPRGKYNDWFASGNFHEIVEAVRKTRSWAGAVHYLHKRFPKLPTESIGRFDELDESTVRYWFHKDFTLKEKFQSFLKPIRNPIGRPSEIPDAIVQQILKQITIIREKGQVVNSVIVRIIIQAILKLNNFETKELKFGRQWISNFLNRKLNWTYRRETWSTMAENRDYIVSAWDSLFKILNPFDLNVQIAAMSEAMNNGLLQLTEEKLEPDEHEDENVYESESDDDENDETTVMQQIREGTRRSARERRPINNSFFVNTSELNSYSLSAAENLTFVNVENWNEQQRKKAKR
jgi:hypothetical protein